MGLRYALAGLLLVVAAGLIWRMYIGLTRGRRER
jgi:hypothetical protein